MAVSWGMGVSLVLACCVVITTEAANGQSGYVTNDTVSVSLPENTAVLSAVIDLSTFVVRNETSSPSPGNDVTTPIPTQPVTKANGTTNGTTNSTTNGTVNGTANGAASENTSSYKFSLLSGNTHDRFAVAENTGVLTLVRPLDVTVDRRYDLNVSVHLLQKNVTASITVTVDVDDVEGYPPVFNDNCKTPVVNDDKGVVVDTKMGFRIAAFQPGADFTPADFLFDPNAVVKISTENDHCGLEYTDVFIAQDVFFAHLVNDSRIVCADADGGNQEGSKMTINVLRPPFSPDDPLQHKIHPATWALMFQAGWVRDNSPFVVLDMTIDQVLSGQNSSWICFGTNDTLRFEVKLEISARGCSEGKYGGLCDLTCVCQNGATCHAFNGACRCAPGWKGVACDIPNPTVLVTASDPTPETGDGINITCHSYNIDADSLKWTRDGKELPEGVIMKSSFYSNHIFAIPRLSKEHEGDYQCVVRDVNGVETRELYRLNVGPPQPPASPPAGIIAMAVLIPAAVLCAAAVAVFFFVTRKRRRDRYKMDSELISWLNDTENKDVLRKWEKKRQHLTIVEQIGQGQFCYVVKAKLRTQTSEHIVAAKTIRADQAGSVVQRDFLRETKLLSDLHLPQDASSPHSTNRNIVQFYGYVLDKTRVYLLVEYAPYGDLRNYLSSCRHRCPSSGQLGVTAEQDKEFLRFARGVANALAELKKKKVIHRDVAARNVLISADREAKICDFGLARDIYTESEYVKLSTQQGDDGPLPIRWMALESLQDGAFTHKTDIWSYGIFLWEIASLGGRPYPDLSADRQLIDWLSGGKRMDRPDSCPDHTYKMMQKCWLKDPAARPDPTELIKDMDNMANEQSTYFFTESCHSPPESSVSIAML